MTTDAPSDDLVENLMRMTTGDAPTDPVSVMAAIAQSSREITRLRTDLTAMEACKNTYATLAYERQEQLFKLRAELAETKRELNDWRQDAVVLACSFEPPVAALLERAKQAERDLATAKQTIASLEGKACLTCGAETACGSDACTFDPSPIEAVKAFLSRAGQAEHDLAEARAQRDASDAVIAFLARGGRYGDDPVMNKAGCEAIARHRAKEGGK